MVRRWIIRSSFIALLALCVGAWIWSRFYLTKVSYTAGGEFLEFASANGGLLMRSDEHGMSPDGFRFDNHPIHFGYDLHWSDISMRPGVHYFLGFFIYQFRNSYYGVERFVGIPIWFLTAMSALTLVFVWRRTRKKLATAFPAGIKTNGNP